MSKYNELVTKLREIFQIDRPELDFGIYRILNARAGEINQYLEQRLPEKVKQALTAGTAAQQAQAAQELKDKEAQYQADGIDPATVPKVQELRQKLAQYTTGANEHENAVFSHLLAFFSRYFDNGDFISQRRYKGDTYAIPYAGEEVMLHWANKDQYYTKSGENFANYSFKLEDGRTVHFRLVAADTAKDNRKDNDKERRFALVERKTVTRIDEQGEAFEEELLPVEEVDGPASAANAKPAAKELIIRFEYKAAPKGTKQEALAAQAVETVLADAAVKARWLDLGQRAPTEKNPQRTRLEKHLSDYTTKNTADYFIHKDLGGFLKRELDFYIKNEVMHLDDVQNAGAFANIEKNMRVIQCLRSIALELITFLAQLEDFQKKLWLKKKFVVSSHYCVTLDRVTRLFREEGRLFRPTRHHYRFRSLETSTKIGPDAQQCPHWVYFTSAPQACLPNALCTAACAAPVSSTSACDLPPNRTAQQHRAPAIAAVEPIQGAHQPALVPSFTSLLFKQQFTLVHRSRLKLHQHHPSLGVQEVRLVDAAQAGQGRIGDQRTVGGGSS